MFNAQEALLTANHISRVQASEDQHRLDIIDKQRTSVLPWRGQFSPQLVEYLLDQNLPSKGTVVDPFCGSGTVLYEAARKRHDSYGWDINPSAISLAKATSICGLSSKQRTDAFGNIEKVSKDITALLDKHESALDVSVIGSYFKENYSGFCNPEIITCFLMIACGDGKELKIKNVKKANTAITRLIENAPMFTGNIFANIGDARKLEFASDAADYLVTSPPYINVFNYHQNYRPIIEALGHDPLGIARAELGANRKFRQNRYITVVQYCMDIALFFTEASRILKEGKKMTIVLGRESNVRGVSFRNGELVATIASDGMGGKILDWNERQFVNRFGTTIYEDVLTLEPKRCTEEVAIEIGRSVGIAGLITSLKYAPEERQSEIQEAIEAGKSVPRSPYVLNESKK